MDGIPREAEATAITLIVGAIALVWLMKIRYDERKVRNERNL